MHLRSQDSAWAYENGEPCAAPDSVGWRCKQLLLLRRDGGERAPLSYAEGTENTQRNGITTGAAPMSNAERVWGGLELIRTRYPQAHSEKSRFGHHVVFVPSVRLPDQYRENICTILFVVPPGFPA